MTRRSDDSQATGSLHLGRELNIGTTTGHVGGNGHSTQQPLLVVQQTVGRLTGEFRVGTLLTGIGVGNEAVLIAYG